MFDSFAKTLIDWRWESLAYVLTKLRPILPTFCSRFSIEKLKGTVDEDIYDEKKRTPLQRMAEALQQDSLMAMCECLWVVSAAVQSEASWTEGCHCHEAIRTANHGYAKRRKLLQAAVGNRACVWEAKRGTEMVLYKAKAMPTNIQKTDSSQFDLLVGRLVEQSKVRVLGMRAQLRNKVAEILTQKLSFWFVLPWRLLGLFGHAVGKPQEAKQCAQACIAEYKEKEAAGRLCALHRAAVRFFKEGSTLWLQLEAFANTAVELADLPELYVAIQEMALSPMSERWIEETHKNAKNAFVRGEHHSPAGACARVRRPETMELFEQPEPRAFLMAAWGKQLSMTDVLTSMGLPRPKSDAELFAKVYGYDLDTMFHDVTEHRKAPGLHQATASSQCLGRSALYHCVADRCRIWSRASKLSWDWV